MILPRRAEPFRQFILDSAARWKLDPCLLAAVLAHESDFLPDVVGDLGHGHGLGQIDDRWHANFIAEKLPDGTPAWKDPARNIEMAASILAEPLPRFARYASPEAAIVAAYNAGAGAVHHALIQLTQPTTAEAEIDALDQICTAGRHPNGAVVYYVSDVLARRAQFAAPPKESA